MNFQEIQSRAIEVLDKYMEAEELERDPSEEDTHFQVQVAGKQLVVELKTTRHSSVEDIKGRLSTAVLELSRRKPHPDGISLVLVYAPRIGRRAARQLTEFMEECAPNTAWGAFDKRGTVVLKVPEVSTDVEVFDRREDSERRTTTHTKRAFTDLNRWILKILMLRDAPSGMWLSEDYRQEVANPAELQPIADVSQAKVYQFANTFRDLGYLKWDRDRFRILERARLFDAWYEEEQQLRVERHPVRSIFMPDAGIRDTFAGEGDNLQYAVGGFEACRILGVLHTPSPTPEVHIFQSVDFVLDRLDLERCPEHDADFFLIDVPYEQSIRRGTIEIESLRVVDILQAALDSGRRARRGREQAEFIVDEILGWQ